MLPLLPTPYAPTPRRRRRAHGFTLIEAALTTVIIGTGVLAIVAAQQAYHIKNDWAQRTGTAHLLANELRELTLTMRHHDPITQTANLGPEGNETSVADWDDLDDFAGTIDVAGFGSGTSFNPPINALRLTIPDMTQWSQHIQVDSVLTDNLNATTAQPLGTTDMMRVTVTISYVAHPGEAAETVTSLSWVVAD